MYYLSLHNLFNIIIIFDTVVKQKRHFKHEQYLINLCRHLATLARVANAWPLPDQRSRHTSLVVNMAIRYFCMNVLSVHPHVEVPRSLVVRNLSVGGKLCLCDDKNAASVPCQKHIHYGVVSTTPPLYQLRLYEHPRHNYLT